MDNIKTMMDNAPSVKLMDQKELLGAIALTLFGIFDLIDSRIGHIHQDMAEQLAHVNNQLNAIQSEIDGVKR